ncbi:MAG: 2-oxoacid:acceptor oxidoreductase family protein [Coriobacteriales bacterium]
MRNVLLTGIGGQGTVLAAKLLAQAAQARGWQVRTAETIGMAQRGGSVVSHVRMGDAGETVEAPLLNRGTAQLIVAFEPGEAARCLPFLAPGGTVVTAATAVQPITAALSGSGYSSQGALEGLRSALQGTDAQLVVVDDAALVQQMGSRKVLNVMLLACALNTGCLPLTLDDLRSAVRACVKPRFVDMNLAAIDTAVR